jgi:4-amino-4-deoxy-L-arabinose transferase-like glycosyltransferase
MYYQWLPSSDPEVRESAIDSARGEPEYEPPLFEALVAVSYLLTGGEHLWLARIWSILFWLIGGAFVYKLGCRVSSGDGGLVSLAYFLYLPFGVLASRSFQPDPLMVMLLSITAYSLLRWSEARTWRWAILTGVLAGATVLVNGRPAPIVGSMLVGVILSLGSIKRSIREPQVWSVVGLATVLPAVYYLGLTREGSFGWISAYSTGLAGLLLDPSLYARWFLFLDELAYIGLALLGVAGIALLPRSARGLLIGLWIGYVLYGLALPYTIYTHDYYNLPIVAIIAVSLAPIGSLILERMASLRREWRVFVIGVGILALSYQGWLARTALLSTDYRSEPLGWVKMGRELPKTGRIIALTHDYGARVAYYGWRRVALWPTRADFAFYQLQGRNLSGDFDTEFDDRTSGYDYFLVTLLGELDEQAMLQEKLYRDFPLAIDGDGYLLFQLRPDEPG